METSFEFVKVEEDDDPADCQASSSHLPSSSQEAPGVDEIRWAVVSIFTRCLRGRVRKHKLRKQWHEGMCMWSWCMSVAVVVRMHQTEGNHRLGKQCWQQQQYQCGCEGSLVYPEESPLLHVLWLPSLLFVFNYTRLSSTTAKPQQQELYGWVTVDDQCQRKVNLQQKRNDPSATLATASKNGSSIVEWCRIAASAAPITVMSPPWWNG